MWRARTRPSPCRAATLSTPRCCCCSILPSSATSAPTARRGRNCRRWTGPKWPASMRCSATIAPPGRHHLAQLRARQRRGIPRHHCHVRRPGPVHPHVADTAFQQALAAVQARKQSLSPKPVLASGAKKGDGNEKSGSTGGAGGGVPAVAGPASLPAQAADPHASCACARCGTRRRSRSTSALTTSTGRHGRTLSAWLIATLQGFILIDGGLPESAALIEANIKTLGFDIKNVKIILNSHARLDYAGGLAKLKRRQQRPHLIAS